MSAFASYFLAARNSLLERSRNIGALPSPSGVGSGSRTIRRVGDHCEIPVDVRVIAATNRDLYETISAGTFREDRFDRLSVGSITLPTLRERRSDIPTSPTGC